MVPYLFLLASFIDKRALSFSLSIFPQHLWSSFALLRSSSSSPSFVSNRHPSITTLLTLRWERATQISGMRSCYLGFEFFLRVFFSLLFRFSFSFKKSPLKLLVEFVQDSFVIEEVFFEKFSSSQGCIIVVEERNGDEHVQAHAYCRLQHSFFFISALFHFVFRAVIKVSWSRFFCVFMFYFLARLVYE